MLPLASRFEAVVDEISQQWLAIFADQLRPLFLEWSNKNVSAESLLNYTVIPYVAYWSYGERLPVIDKGTADPKGIGYSFDTIAALIGNRLGNRDLLVSNREGYVSAFARPLPIADPVRLIISFSSKDRAFAEELDVH